MDVSSQMFPQQTGHLVEPFFVWCFLPTEKIIDFFESIKNHQLLNFEIFGVFLLGLMPYKKKCKSKTCFEMSIQKRCRSFLVNLLELRSPFEAKMMHESRYIMNILHVANLKFWNPPPNTATNAVTWTQTGCPYGIPHLGCNRRDVKFRTSLPSEFIWFKAARRPKCPGWIFVKKFLDKPENPLKVYWIWSKYSFTASPQNLHVNFLESFLPLWIHHHHLYQDVLPEEPKGITLRSK